MFATFGKHWNIPYMKRFFTLLLSVLPVCAYAGPLEKSALFYRHVDSLSGVVSYVLRPGLVKDNSQCLYFTQKCMTDDGRFVLCVLSDSERNNPKSKRRLYVIDLKKDKITCLVERCYVAPYLDEKEGVIYYCEMDNPKGIYKINLRDPEFREVLICKIPEELRSLGKVRRLCNHMQLTSDNRYVFCDSRVDDRFIQGRIDLADGSYEFWGETPFNLNHGQINPSDKDLALAAHENGWTDSGGVRHSWQYEPGKCPRLQLLAKDRRDTVKVAKKKAYHECWDSRGDGFFYCGGGVFYYDLKTKETTQVAPPGNHADMTADLKYVVMDIPLGSDYRGRPWRVRFWNRETGRGVMIHSFRPAITTPEKPSRLHPDPHPHFSCRDRYIVCTMNGYDGNMHLSITPVDQLVKMTSSE